MTKLDRILAQANQEIDDIRATHRPCQICGQEVAVARLIDQNGHTWHIGEECVQALWHERQQMNMEEREKEAAVEWVLSRLRELLLGQEAK